MVYSVHIFCSGDHFKRFFNNLTKNHSPHVGSPLLHRLYDTDCLPQTVPRLVSGPSRSHHPPCTVTSAPDLPPGRHTKHTQNILRSECITTPVIISHINVYINLYSSHNQTTAYQSI